MELLMPLKAWVVAHPIECATLMLLLLSALNGVLRVRLIRYSAC